jgi:bla regulator protein BlaR1
MFAIGQSNFLQALGWAVLNSLWQMALLWVVYQVITAVFRNIGSSQKSALATLLLFLGFGWFLLSFFVIWSDASSAHTGYSSLLVIEGNQAVNDWLQTMLPMASVFYLALLTLPMVNFIRNYRYLRVIRHSGLVKADVQWRMFVQKLAAQMGINKPVQVWMSEFVSSPVTIGYLKPIILLPLAAVNHLSTQQTEAVLLHELSHIRRFDFLYNLVIRVIQTILYFNPFVKAFANIIDEEREKHCDEMVLQFQYEPHGYASALLALEKAAHSPALAMAASGNKRNNLLHRIERIMGIRKQPVFSFNKLAGLVAAFLCFISLNALLLLARPGETKIRPGLLTDLTVPFHLFTPSTSGFPVAQPDPALSTEENAQKEEIVSETTASVTNQPPSPPNPPSPDAPMLNPGEPTDADAIDLNMESIQAPVMNVNFTAPVIPELAPQEEARVREALAVSKRILTEDQWKLVEKSIADAMTMQEKEQLKQQYRKAMNRVDWEKLEDKLKIAYEDINWNEINAQMNLAMAEIKLDSLQKVYSLAVANLSAMEKELKKVNECGVPDSDITIKKLHDQRKEAQEAINKLKAVRLRKVVRL